ncbi:uncharacterized protein LOC128956489 [Oppia nitens]|uniref:uncharacterized protein LOC128956489 n=1 Tax=Oppia nitens TaxID=1686743 RepID=UPI0023DC865D|nr:uncharacterized protein LOC128956489 [Oppia nitens]
MTYVDNIREQVLETYNECRNVKGDLNVTQVIRNEFVIHNQSCESFYAGNGIINIFAIRVDKDRVLSAVANFSLISDLKDNRHYSMYTGQIVQGDFIGSKVFKLKVYDEYYIRKECIGQPGILRLYAMYEEFGIESTNHGFICMGRQYSGVSSFSPGMVYSPVIEAQVAQRVNLVHLIRQQLLNVYQQQINYNMSKSVGK